MPTTVTCPGCGGFVPLGDRFCGACGQPITGSALMNAEGNRFDPWEELLQKLRQATIGEYEIRGELGRGGMAAVLLAHDLQLNRKVAIKVMLPGLVYGASMWDRFLSEARTAAKLDHQNIIYIHSVKEKDRFLYFVMKYIDGRSLDDILATSEPLPIPVAQTILAEVARALDYAHHEGVVHRDIKPANIMIDQKGNSIVMDFGIARATDEKRFTQTGATIGTPAYMSPEQCRGNETTAASDQYSLGILAYEMLAGAAPFNGTPIELQIAHMQDAPRSLRDLRPEISLELSGAVMKMLAKDPAERWPSLAQLVPIFARGLDPNDDAPRNHLVGLVRAGSPRRKSFPATPVSPTPASLNVAATPSSGSPATSGPMRVPTGTPTEIPAAVTTSVNAHELAEHARRLSAESAAITSGQHASAPSLSPATGSAAVQSAPAESATPVTEAEPQADAAAEPMTATAESPIEGEGEGEAPAAEGAPRRSRGLLVGLGTGVAVAAIYLIARSGKQSPSATATAPDSAAAAAAVTAAAAGSGAAAVEAALGDSVVIGHGTDATRTVNGKAPRTVNVDAVSNLLLTLPRARVSVGDTVRARLDAQDDAGLPITTHQIVWTTSNPRVARFLVPGQLYASAVGKAVITVTSGTASTSAELTVVAKGVAAPTRKAAARAKRDSTAKAP